MSKPYKEEDLVAQITEDRTWRIREISDLKNAIRRADSALQRVLLRSLVTICYAHWEGFVRHSARKYLEHISLRRLTYEQLNRQFLRNLFLPRLGALSQSNTSTREKCNLIDLILSASQLRFSQVNLSLINTQSNLNSFVILDICLVCGIPNDWFVGNENFLDVILLKRRNSIAHGEETFVEADEIDNIVDQTIALMRGFGDALENNIVLQMYRSL